MAYQTSAGLDDSFAVIRHSIESGEKLSLNKLSELENLYEDDNKGQGDDEDMNMSDDIQSLTPEQLLEDERKKERLSSETASGTEDRGPKIGMDFLNASKAMNAELQKRSNSRGRNKSEGDGSETRRMLRRATSGDLVYGNIGSSSHSRNSPEFERQPLRRTKSTSGEELFGSRHKPGLRGRSSASVEQLRRSSSHSASGDQFQRSTHSSRGMRRSTHSRRSGSQSSEQLAADIAKAAAEAAIEFDSDDSDVEDRDATTRRKEESQVISSIESESKQEGSSQRQKRTGTPFSATLRRPSTTTREENTQEPERRRSRGRSQRRASSSQGSKRSTSASLHGDSSTRGRRNRDISTDSRRISSSLHGRQRDRSESRQRSSSQHSSRREDPRSRSLSRSRSGTSSSSISGHSQRGGVRRASSASADLFELAKLAHRAKRDAKRDGPSELKNTRSGDRDLRALVKHAKEDRKERKSKKRSGRKPSDRSGKDSSKETKPSAKEQSMPKEEEVGHDSLKLKRGVLDEIKQRSADSDGDQKSKNKASAILRNAVAGRSKWGGVRSGMEFINKVKKASKESRSSEKVTDTSTPEAGKSNTSKWGGVKHSFEFINKTKGLLKDKKNKNNDEDMQRFAEVVFSSDLMKMKAEALVAAGAKEEEQNDQKPLGGVDGENKTKNAKHSLGNVDHSISAEARSRIFGDVLTSPTTSSEVERSHAKAPESKISVEAERKGKGADVPSGGEQGPFEDPKTHGPVTSFEVEAQVQSSKVLPNVSENKVAENAARVNDVPTQTPEKLVTSETTSKVVTPDSNPPETSNLPPKKDRSPADSDHDDTCSSTSDSAGNQLDMSIFLSPLKCAQLQIQPDQQEKKELTIQIHGLSKTDDEDDDAGADDILFLDNRGVEHEAYDAWRKQGAMIPLFGIDSKQPAENDGTNLAKAQAKNADFEFEINPSAQSVKEINQDSSVKNMLATELKHSKTRLRNARDELSALEASLIEAEANFRSADSRFLESTNRLATNKVVLNRLRS